VLGIAETATAEEVRGAYLAKVREFPPEREPEGFKAVHRAYATLKDAARRKALDLSVFRRGLGNEAATQPVDCAALFRERVFRLVLASSDLYAEDLSRFYADVERDIEGLS
jgi:DnaJ-class molecular chaperone